MKKTYTTPSAQSVAFDTEDILAVSFTGTAPVLKDSDKNNSSKKPATDFGAADLF